MEIRAATAADADAIVVLGDEFIANSPYGTRLRSNHEQMRRLIAWLLEHGVIFVAIDDGRMVGMLGLAVAPHPITGDPFGHELMWFVTPKARGTTGVRLLKRAEAWAREQGAECLRMVAPDSRVAKLYTRLGYEQIEVVFDRRL